jgi:tRNA1Val (adenine37-N6)-methyltransferase
MTTDELWPDGPRFIVREDVFRLGTDSVLLSAFSQNGHDKRVCDLGCGSGVIAVLLAWDNPAAQIDGVELQPDWAELARDNARVNGLDNRITIHCLDLRRYKELPAGAYDLVTANPPYYPQGSGKSAQSAPLAQAREERTCSLTDITQAAAYLTRWGGRFTLVHKPERLSEVLCACSQAGLEPKRLRFVHHQAVKSPSLFLLECRRGARPSLRLEAPLVLTDDGGGDSAEIKAIYHRL